MSINFNKFVPRPGLVNKQGRLPDPSELVCIEVPKVFDQCLIKRCLVYGAGPDTDATDCELRSNPLIDPKRFIGCRCFKVTLISVEKIPLRKKPDFKKMVIHYMISFYADYIDCNGVNKCELFEIFRTDVIGKFYCPDSIAQISANHVGDHRHQEDENIIKLEMVAECLDGEILQDCDCNDVLDITLGYFLVIKCELIVQLLIPAYHYCPIPKECCSEEEPEENACERFINAPIPKFYPKQNLQPLFPDCNDIHVDNDNDEDENEDEDINIL